MAADLARSFGSTRAGTSPILPALTDISTCTSPKRVVTTAPSNVPDAPAGTPRAAGLDVVVGWKTVVLGDRTAAAVVVVRASAVVGSGEPTEAAVVEVVRAALGVLAPVDVVGPIDVGALVALPPVLLVERGFEGGTGADVVSVSNPT